MKIRQKKNNNQKAFTLVELMIVVGILVFVVSAMLQLYFFTGKHVEMAGNITEVLNDAQNQLESIRNMSFDEIPALNGTPFDLTDHNGIETIGTGVITVNDTNPDLLVVTVTACWQDRFGHISGEDANFNGMLEEEEDIDGDGVLDSPVSLMTMIARRE